MISENRTPGQVIAAVLSDACIINDRTDSRLADEIMQALNLAGFTVEDSLFHDPEAVEDSLHQEKDSSSRTLELIDQAIAQADLLINDAETARRLLGLLRSTLGEIRYQSL